MNNLTYISIHVRRADYARHLSILYNMTFVDIDYFVNATKYFNNNFQVNLDTFKF